MRAPLFAPSDMGPRYPTATDITQWVKRTQLSSVELTQGHVETLLKVLEYDGRVERLPASTAAMFASALNASKRENADDTQSGKKARKRKRVFRR
jgi:DNA-directed RNA polymerase III subunit RPC6